MINWKGNERAIIIMLGFCIVSCALLPFTAQEPKVWTSAFRPKIDNDQYEESTRMINMMTNRKTTPSKILEYISKNLPYLPPQEKTQIMYKYHAYLRAQRPEFDKKIFYQGNHKMIYQYFYYAYQPKWIETIQEKPFKDVMMELDQSGYYLKRDKDLYHPFIDYERLTGSFSGMTEEGRIYLEIMSMYDDISTSKLSKEELFYKNIEKLLLKCDYFINKFPLSEKSHEIQALFNDQLSVFIFGNKEFESFDNDSGKVDESLAKSYLRLATNLKSKNLAIMLERYTKMVIQNDHVVVNDFLNYIDTGIQKNRSDYIVSKHDHIRVLTDLVTFSGVQQYIPRIEGFRDPAQVNAINEKLLENVYKYVFKGRYRGYQMQSLDMNSNYQIAYASNGLVSIFQNIQMSYGTGQQFQYGECFNYDFSQGKELTFEDLFLNYHLQKKKIMESLEIGMTNYEIGTFQEIETIELDKIDNFVITNDGIEVFLSLLDDSGSKVGFITVELSYSDFYTIIEPEYRF